MQYTLWQTVQLLLRPTWTHVHSLLTSQFLELLSAFSSCSPPFPPTWKSPSLPVLVPDTCLPVPGACVCFLTARTDSSLLYTRVTFSRSVMLECSCGRAESTGGRVAWGRREPRKPCSSAKAMGCSSFACSDGMLAAWLMGAVRRSNVLCAEDSQILSTNHTELGSPQWDGCEIPLNVGKIKSFALS